MKRSAALLMSICMLACMWGCGTDRPSAEYDAGSQTVTVSGHGDYSELVLPEEVKKARVLEVRDDTFEMSIYLLVLRGAGRDEPTLLSGMIDRTAKSLAFLREYLGDNAGEACPASRANEYVAIHIDRNAFCYADDGETITLSYSDAGTHREFLYLLALTDSCGVGWEQTGYAWYVGTCIDPYSERTDIVRITPGLPYYNLVIGAGIDPENIQQGDMRRVYDVISRFALEKGLTRWGSPCESYPVSSEEFFSRKDGMQPGDTSLSAFMAASFIAWLDDYAGFENLSMFCFGLVDFEEAFGTDYYSALEAWKEWIYQTYPMN